MDQQLSPRLRAIQVARQVLEKRPVYLDTETTGLGSSDEIIEMAIVDDDNQILFQSFVKPSRPIPADASRIHGITNEMVAKSQAWPILWPQIRNFLTNRTAVIYNQEFDIRLMQQSFMAYKMQMKDRIDAFDLMLLYGQFRGEWDPKYRHWKYHSLDAAGKQCRIPLPNAHRAAADSLLSRALLHYIAEQP